jgi:hypothetical protein
MPNRHPAARIAIQIGGSIGNFETISRKFDAGPTTVA